LIRRRRTRKRPYRLRDANAGRYLARFRSVKQRLAFNVAAFLLAPFWLAYRSFMNGWRYYFLSAALWVLEPTF
jgi:hypothetical protein